MDESLSVSKIMIKKKLTSYLITSAHKVAFYLGNSAVVGHKRMEIMTSWFYMDFLHQLEKRNTKLAKYMLPTPPQSVVQFMATLLLIQSTPIEYVFQLKKLISGFPPLKLNLLVLCT